MNVSARSVSTALSYQMYLYRRPLHPEIFPLKGRKVLAHGQYELEAWITSGGHMLRFRHGQFSCCELLTNQDDHLPIEGAVTGFPCTGEHEFEHRFAKEKVAYTTSIQTENLGDNLYRSTYEEMLDYAKQTEALTHKWADDQGRRCLSLLDLQRLNKEVHCQGYHLVAGSGFVLRTQTIFEHL